MRRRHAEYRPAPWYRRRFGRRLRLLRGARLNGVGWAAFGAVCLAGGALGYAAGSVTAYPAAAAVAGALAVALAVVAVDRRRWRRSWTGFSWDATPEATRLVADELRRAGLEVEVEVGSRPGIRVRNRDRRRVGRVLTGLGIRPPRW
ncbi:hypothetical protein GCM10009557_76790 [Virgisporangium ochraceum]|uniref:Uncharacterized protein n=1 Tax=Virgisporangium ochraceum TaxID=65505 RepID=A0A8J3ZZS7_9ACTN|nr:hypothetical protein [Virgisporangium ochraceum]GIJ73082.1 hypothetical protein Voc01_079990 [Virgisporangium ochraceum]